MSNVASSHSEANHFNDLKEKHSNTIANIQRLQELEKYMFKNLEKLAAGGSDNKAQEQAIVSKINELKNVRTGLLKQLSSLYTDKQTELNDERSNYSSTLTQIGIIEDELDRARKNVGIMETNRDNKLRMAQLYEYERKRYGAYTDLMKYIVYGCLVILACVLLIRYNPIPIIPTHLYSGLIVLTIVVVIVLLGRKIVDINSRNNLNFDQYDFYFDPATVDPGYETVYQHDVNFFKGVESDFGAYVDEAKHEYKKLQKDATKYSKEFTNSVEHDASSYMSKAKHDINKMKQNIAHTVDGSGAGSGKSNGVINHPTTTAKVPGSASLVMPSESSKETFATYN